MNSYNTIGPASNGGQSLSNGTVSHLQYLIEVKKTAFRIILYITKTFTHRYVSTYPWVWFFTSVLALLCSSALVMSASCSSSITSLVSNMWCNRWLTNFRVKNNILSTAVYNPHVIQSEGNVCKVNTTQIV